MASLRFLLVTLNAAAFIALLFSAIRLRRRSHSAQVRRLWAIVALTAAALVLGASQRLVLQAGAAGWIPEAAVVDAVEGWQFVQSAGVAALVIAIFTSVRRLARDVGASEAIAGSLLERVEHVDPDRLDLTPRELEVLSEIGAGRITDAELSESLHISVSTVQSHVKSLLRKTKLSRRQDLIAVAGLLERSRE